MKLLVCDYDGTLNSDIKNLRLNIKAINKFMESGNKFMIATGRSYDSIKREINYFNIKYDYLSCNSGLILFDKNDNILCKSPLSFEDYDYITEFLDYSEDVKGYKIYNFFHSTNNFENILELYAKFKSTKKAKEAKELLEQLKNNIRCFQMKNKLFISNNVTKANYISYIAETNNIELKDIYTVGDGTNDIEMLEEYNGYKMLYSCLELWFKKLPITREVHTLVKKINQEGKNND